MSVETLQRELISDLSEVQQDRFADEKLCAELYRALTRTKLRKPGAAEGHVVLSLTQAEGATTTCAGRSAPSR